MPRRVPVLVSVVDEIAEHPPVQAPVDGRLDAGPNVLQQCDVLSLVHGPLLRADVGGQAAEVRLLQLQRLLPLLQTGKEQELADHRLHAGALRLDGGQRLPVVLLRLRQLQPHLALRHDDGERRPQLVRNVRRETLFPGKGGLQAIQHPVHGVGELVQFVIRLAHLPIFSRIILSDMDAVGEVLLVPYVRCGLHEFVDGR